LSIKNSFFSDTDPCVIIVFLFLELRNADVSRKNLHVHTTLSKGYVQFVQRKGSSRTLCEEQIRLESFDLWTWLIILCVKERLKLAKAILEISVQRLTIDFLIWLH
jgi:hypothetical protein